MDLNAAKYPREALFYTDIKSYEQGAGQKISTSENELPALACLPLQENWFWKPKFPTDKMKSAKEMVKDNIDPYGLAHCNFILNVAPNRDGLMDDNALKELKEIGKLYTKRGHVADVKAAEAPIISRNIAKAQPSTSSYSDDYNIMDFANDDNFKTCWTSSPTVQTPWYAVELGHEQPFNMVVITDRDNDRLQNYVIEYRANGTWHKAFEGNAPSASRVKIHRFDTVWGDAVRLTVNSSKRLTSIAEFGVFNEKR